MRPVRLTLQAFGPFAGREVIDFRDAVEAGLFGIYGQTGSGKSTIFSAMTFALFGEPAKSEQEPPSLRSDHADPGLPTEVEFVFDVNGRRYVALRRPDQMRPRTRGEGETRSVHEAWLFDATGMAPDEITETRRGKALAEKKVREVDQAIAGILGYGAGQFRQIVLLPQGRFEVFLSAKTRERLDILRELFDVSIYQALMADLRAGAEAAERQVREERALCARQLAAEGFESADALAAGIGEAGVRCAQLLADEGRARATLEAAGDALKAAEAIDGKFAAAEQAAAVLAGLRAQGDAIGRLADRVARADRARSLPDAEARVGEASREAGEAEERLRGAQEAARLARTVAEAAAGTLGKEAARSGEAEALRRKIDGFDRFGQILDKAADSADAVAAALAAERAAAADFEAAGARLAELQATRRQRAEALRAAHQSEVRRADLTARVTGLTASHAAARAWEKAGQDVARARGAVAEQTAAQAAALRRAADARAHLDAAERDLSAAQALHLASKLAPGSPCPVCGATEHPAPATGAAGNAGLDHAFREARRVWQDADDLSRAAAERLAGLKSALAEREDVLAGLDRPGETSERLAMSLAAAQRDLAGVGPAIDIAAAEAGLDGLDREIAGLEQGRDLLRDALDARRQAVAEATATCDAVLSAVPEAMRRPEALAAAAAAARNALDGLMAAMAAAERAARETRDAMLSAEKDRQAAEQVLATCRERHQRAGEAFRARLAQAGLSAADYLALKPAIGTIDADRETVEDYRRRLRSAGDAATAAATAIETLARPDTAMLRESRTAAEGQLSAAMELRVAAKARADHLARLRESLAETLHRLDEAEAASGPLRGLAALVNGNNPQKLTLETYAIGAMFDQVLGAANLRLGPMTAGRYRLERDLDGTGRGSRGLGIQVFDLHTGKSRPTSTLSGGESFIAALALALGLADVVESASGKVRLDTIFIDEGFGSLDTENGSGTLDQVLQVLNALVSQNRAVGLISHVPLVQDAIPNGFYVRKGLAGSRVEARGPV